MARSVNEELLDALIRHQTYLLRYSGYVRNRIWSILDRTEGDIAMRIRDKLRDSAGLTSPVEVRRMEALMAAIEAMRRESWEEATRFLLDEMEQLAYQEPIALRGIMTTVAPVVVETVMPATRLLRAIALSRPFEGRVLKDWASTMEAEDIRRIHAAIQLGMVAGETGAQIATRVVGTGALNNADGALEMTRRQVQAITRTAVQHVANSARAEFLQENADVIVGEQFVATLDSRTTPVCRANDGKVFPVGTGPRPPLHFQCRSLRVAAFDGERLGYRPFKSSTTKQLLREFADANNLKTVPKSRNDLPRGTKGAFDDFSRKRVRELTGRVPASTGYQAWLRNQSKQFQEDTLGVTKAKLFREGGLTLDKFVAASGSELTLAQLAAKHASAFKAAGLDPEDFI